MMEYKGYIARVAFDDDSGFFHGEVLNLRDVITFQGDTVKGLRRAFRESVEDYLEFCAQRNEEPERPYSGRFLLRIDPFLHKAIATRARLEDKSLNTWVRDLLADALE